MLENWKHLMSLLKRGTGRAGGGLRSLSGIYPHIDRLKTASNLLASSSPSPLCCNFVCVRMNDIDGATLHGQMSKLGRVKGDWGGWGRGLDVAAGFRSCHTLNTCVCVSGRHLLLDSHQLEAPKPKKKKKEKKKRRKPVWDIGLIISSDTDTDLKLNYYLKYSTQSLVTPMNNWFTQLLCQSLQKEKVIKHITQPIRESRRNAMS